MTKAMYARMMNDWLNDRPNERTNKETNKHTSIHSSIDSLTAPSAHLEHQHPQQLCYGNVQFLNSQVIRVAHGEQQKKEKISSSTTTTTRTTGRWSKIK